MGYLTTTWREEDSLPLLIARGRGAHRQLLPLSVPCVGGNCLLPSERILTQVSGIMISLVLLHGVTDDWVVVVLQGSGCAHVLTGLELQWLCTLWHMLCGTLYVTNTCSKINDNSRNVVLCNKGRFNSINILCVCHHLIHSLGPLCKLNLHFQSCNSNN